MLRSDEVRSPDDPAPLAPRNHPGPRSRVPVRAIRLTSAGAVAGTTPEPPPSSSTSVSTLAAEIALLEEARRSLANDPTTTLAKVAEHRARFAKGGLSSERDLLELDALRRTGRTTEARARAQAWLERDPAGLHSTRVRRILEALE
jgi:hypothetical protein